MKKNYGCAQGVLRGVRCHGTVLNVGPEATDLVVRVGSVLCLSECFKRDDKVLRSSSEFFKFSASLFCRILILL